MIIKRVLLTAFLAINLSGQASACLVSSATVKAELLGADGHDTDTCTIQVKVLESDAHKNCPLRLKSEREYSFVYKMKDLDDSCPLDGDIVKGEVLDTGSGRKVFTGTVY